MKSYRKNKITIKELLPLVLIIGIIPVIVYIHSGPNSYGDYPWCTAGNITDLFLYGKSIALIAVATVMLILFCYNCMKKCWIFEDDNYVFYLLFGYVFFAILSTIGSKYRTVAVHGASEQYESVFVLISYSMVCFFSYYAANALHEDKALTDRFYRWILPLSLIPVLFICVSQFLHMDFLKFILQKWNFDFIFPAGTVYGAFYNPNFVGSYVVLLFPLLIALLIAANKWSLRLFTGILSVMILIALAGSKSASGFLVLGIALIIFAVMQIKDRTSGFIFGGIILAVIIAAVGFDFATGNYYSSKVWASIHPSATEKTLEKIETTDTDIEITYRGKQLNISLLYDENSSEPFQFGITDEQGESIAYEINSEGRIQLTDDDFSGIIIYPAYMTNMDDLLTIVVVIDDKNWIFTNQTDGAYYYLNNYNHLDKIDNAPMAVFNNNPGFASGRGFLWGKTIPLLKDYIFVGSGPDTYGFVYPQSDYVDKFNNGYENTYVTRPHNMYLQTAVQTGVLSLICILVFYGIYFVQSFRIYRKAKKDDLFWYVGYGIFIGSVGYMLIGLFNDSTITVAPIYWCLIGIGYAINKKIKAKE